MNLTNKTLKQLKVLDKKLSKREDRKESAMKKRHERELKQFAKESDKELKPIEDKIEKLELDLLKKKYPVRVAYKVGEHYFVSHPSASGFYATLERYKKPSGSGAVFDIMFYYSNSGAEPENKEKEVEPKITSFDGFKETNKKVRIDMDKIDEIEKIEL